MMDNEQPHQELVKCVVVGDTAVGKTRLICARACNKHVSLSQLMTTHVPTVWAIDQYRIYKDVLERSWEVVDGVNVSLRLWDTFGDHEKDRRFAYGRSDVVLLCFSITNPGSLRNCVAMWYPEIRRFCPQTPVLLIGCKNDLRYMYRDQAYLSFFKDRSPFLRLTRKSDLVMPDEARSIARELGISYYETSVLTYYGVNEVFENAIRAALLARRNQRFWMTNLKRVQKPMLQAPYLPPQPVPPQVFMTPSSYDDHIKYLYCNPVYTDLVLFVGNIGFAAHRIIVGAASRAFLRVFTNGSLEMSGRSSSDSSMSTLGESSWAEFNDDTECLLRSGPRAWDQWRRRNSCQVAPSSKKPYVKELNLPGFESICVKMCPDTSSCRSSSLQTIVQMGKAITADGLSHCLQFIYTGAISCTSIAILNEVKQAADFLEIPELSEYISNIISREEFSNVDLTNNFRQRMREWMMPATLQGLFSDVLFQLDDGWYPAHRALLVARCDVMRAMFSGDFRESGARVIIFKGVTEDTFTSLLHYLYSDEIPDPTFPPSRSIDLLEIGNRLCLPRLVTLTEYRVVKELMNLSDDDAIEHCLQLLEPSQLYNAHQLADWCMNYLCRNYNAICKSYLKLLKNLIPENQDYLKEHRWPPVWYLKDYDYYEKCWFEKEKEEKKVLRRARTGSGCLCFSTTKTRNQTDLPQSIVSGEGA